jgi:hypothetical protein
MTGTKFMRISSWGLLVMLALTSVSISSFGQADGPRSFPTTVPTRFADGQSLPEGTVRIGALIVTLMDGRILISGGQTEEGKPISEATLYDPTTGASSVVTPMLFKRWNHVATLLPDGRVLVVGGGTGFSANPEIYDPRKDHWAMAGTMMQAPTDTDSLTTGHVTFKNGSLQALNDGRILAVGTNGNSSQIYDPARDRWSLSDLK